VTRFSYTTAHRILSSQREATLYASGQADFEKLKSLGVKDAYLVNLSGLMWAGQRKFNEASDLFEEASSINPGVDTYKSNFITVARTPDRMERALRLLDVIDDAKLKEFVNSHPWGFFSYAKVLAIAYRESWPDSNKERLRWMAPIALSLSVNAGVDSIELINKAMSKLKAEE